MLPQQEANGGQMCQAQDDAIVVNHQELDSAMRDTSVYNDKQQLSGDNFKQLMIYISSIIVIALTTLNASLFVWIVVSLDARNNLGQQSDSFVRLTPAGVHFHGQSMFNSDLVVSRIRAKSPPRLPEGRPNDGSDGSITDTDGTSSQIDNDATIMRFDATDANLTFNCGPTAAQQSQQQISLGSNGVISLGESSNQFVILAPGAPNSAHAQKVIINSSGVLMEASKLTATNRQGLDARGLSVQTGRLCGQEGLSLHSATRKLSLLAPRGIRFESTNGSVSIEASERVSVRSSAASVILASPLIDATNIKTIIGSQTGRTYMNIYKVCHCHLAQSAARSRQNSRSSITISNNWSHSNLSDTDPDLAIGWRHGHTKRSSSRKGSLAQPVPSPAPAPNMQAPPSSKSQQQTTADHPRLGLLFGVKPSLNCSSFNWFCNMATL